MTSSFAHDLDQLRGFGPLQADGTGTLPELSPLERLLPHAQPLKVSDEEALLLELVLREASLFGAIMRTSEGKAEWDCWVTTDEAQSWKTSPPAKVEIPSWVLVSRHPMELLEALDGAGVHRLHRAHFLRHVRRRSEVLAGRYREEFAHLDEAQQPLFLKNLRLTLWCTRIPAFSNRESLIYGAIGLMDSIDRFELGRARVSTYARTWIKARKSRASGNWVNAMRDSGHAGQRRMNVRSAAAETRATGGEPTVDGLVERVEMLEPSRMAEVYRGRPLGARLAAEGLAEAPRLLDLGTEEPLHDWERAERLTVIWEAVQDEIAQLPDRQRRIAAARLGLEGGEKPTLSEVGRDFGLSRERIRQLERSAFEAIRRRVLRALQPGDDGEP